MVEEVTDMEIDAEAIFIPQLLMDLIQRLAERGVLESADAKDLITSSLATTAECNPAAADWIGQTGSFYERFAQPRTSAQSGHK